MQQISIHKLVMGDLPFFLADLSNLLGLEATPVSTLLLFRFQCAVKLILLSLIVSWEFFV
jgi:hypothetical protein